MRAYMELVDSDEEFPIGVLRVMEDAKIARKVSHLCCMFAVFMISSVAYGYLMERNYVELKLAEDASWFVAAMIFCFQSMCAVSHMTWHQQRIPVFSVPKTHLALLGAISMTSSGFSAYSLKYVNYPTNIMVKSCKLLPVMIGSAIMLKIKYQCSDVTSCLLMCFGVAAFVLAGKDITPNFSFLGITALVISVSADGLLGNMQKKLFQNTPQSSAEELTAGTTMFGAAINLTLLFFSGNLWSSVMKVQEKGPLTWMLLVAQATFGYINTTVVLILVEEFDPLTAMSMATLKRVVAIIGSFIFFSKAFSYQYLWSGVLVLLGLYGIVFSKLRRDAAEQKKKSEQGMNNCV
ncbi:unnamed protein product [Notodromas monacha]|uniref:Adenosine 3'-phospho 5'-phosphosulfate transporter 2 n=1 Tax=Notodromas monacha TaxID=399045 RepID=A0A7R9BZR2_9CRUS|nr:unnamed protein product [Notodromas monacha]CAG0923329.1 unnamed protein product [Notodromas monacha]